MSITRCVKFGFHVWPIPGGEGEGGAANTTAIRNHSVISPPNTQGGRHWVPFFSLWHDQYLNLQPSSFRADTIKSVCTYSHTSASQSTQNSSILSECLLLFILSPFIDPLLSGFVSGCWKEWHRQIVPLLQPLRMCGHNKILCTSSFISELLWVLLDNIFSDTNINGLRSI